MSSPFAGLGQDKWVGTTEKLLRAYPATSEDIVKAVLAAWNGLFETKIGGHLIIGKDVFPSPQIMASYLHELIPIEFGELRPGKWRGDQSADEKDLVYIPDVKFSAEIKCSSHKTKIFGNRSYAQNPSSSKKSKDGYFIAVNFQKFASRERDCPRPEIIRVRFGWLDHTDWRGQASATGQQANLKPESETRKLLTLYDATDGA